jgi:tetratricopeptide (TPR) repeat protein
MTERGIQPVVKPSAGVLIAILVILLAAAILLLVLAESREQIIASYALFALVASIVTFGFLGATGTVKTKGKQVGGSAAVFVVILGMLLPFAGERTADIRGMLYVDGAPAGEAEIYLLETDTMANRCVLEEYHKGQFEFKDVRGLKDEVRFSVKVPGYDEKVVDLRHKSGEVARIELSTDDLTRVIVPPESSGSLPPGFQLPSAAPVSGTEPKTVCIHDFTNTSGQPQYDHLGASIAAGIASRLEDAPGVQLADRATLRQIKQRLGLGDPVDEGSARMLGEMVGTSFSLVGSFGYGDVINVNARLVNNGTGEQLFSVSKASRDRDYLEEAVAFEMARSLGVFLQEPPVELSASEPSKHADEDEAQRLFDEEDYAGAFYAYCRASDLDLSDIYLHRRVEKCTRLAGLQGEFLRRYERLVRQHPENAVLCNYLGNAYLMLDASDASGKAREQYEKSLRMDPKFAPPLNNLGIIEFRQNNLISAKKWFTQYLEAVPEDAAAWVNLGILNTKMFERDHGNSQAVHEAERDFQKAIQIQPGLASAHMRFGKLLEVTGRSSEALAAYQRSLMLDHNQPELRQRVEELRGDVGGSGTSSSDLDGMQTRGIRNGAILELTDQVTRAIDEGDLQKAEELAAELCLAMPSNPLAYRLIGRVYELQGREDEARKAFGEANSLSSLKEAS